MERFPEAMQPERVRRVIPYSLRWIQSRTDELWYARSSLQDDLSKLLFDLHLVLRATSHTQFYYPRLDLDDLVIVLQDVPFATATLPSTYLGLPLRQLEVQLTNRVDAPKLSMISTSVQVRMMNSYRQYFIRRGDANFSPVLGETVIDCGSCIGEISAVFGTLVGPSGHVHMFDPVPLHARYCEAQLALNPTLRPILKMNVFAVGDRTADFQGTVSDVDRIEPGTLTIDSFRMISLDSYMDSQHLNRVDYIKMDIEGAEIDALEGAQELIARFGPRLAISAYHKPEHLWEIPEKICKLRGDYRLYFGHHSPIQWESVYYAMSSGQAA
jgi:FkbM family methyltransferase